MSESFHFFGAIIWYQAFSEMFAEFFFYFLQRKWSHWNGLQWLGTFDTPFKKSVMGFFFQKTYFFEVETTNHYFFCSILSDNEPMCGFSKKKEMFNKNTTRKKIFEKTNRIGKKSRTLSKHLVIAMSSSKWADSVLKLQNKDIMIIFRLFPGYFLLIDYLCTYTIPPISSQLKLKITISFILVLPWICTIIA